MSTMNIPMPREQLERLVRQVVRQQYAARLAGGQMSPATAYAPNLVVNTSARHMHVSREDLQTLFGPGAELTVYRWLYQPGEFASEQTVTIMGPRMRTIAGVRILGPVRQASQIELSFTDSIAMGLAVPVRPSGNIDGTPGCYVFGPKGMVELPRGVIRAERHVHMSPADAASYGFRDRQHVRLRVQSTCTTVFENLLCRVNPQFLLEVHVDTDESNACDLVNASKVELMA
jgi:propanediol utilization protein